MKKSILPTICIVLFSLTLFNPLFGNKHQLEVRKYSKSSTVKTVFNAFEAGKTEIKSHWKAIAGLYSPPGNETLRAQYISNQFKKYNLSKHYIDKHGNAVGIIDGHSAGPTILFLGTMDDLETVALRVKERKKPILEKDGKMMGPGTHSSSTCATLVALAKLFTLPQVRFKGKIMLVGVVQEETGLNGIKWFLRDYPGKIDYVVDIMAGIGDISYGAVGIHQFKIHFKGPKGHTLLGGLPNVTRGVAKAVDRIFNIPLPKEPALKRSYINIAMLGAGKVYNHKSSDAWFSIDLRSMDEGILLNLKKKIFTIAEAVAKSEKLTYYVEPFSEIPAGQLPGARQSKLVRISEEVSKLFRENISLTARGSSNMNVAIGKKISAINIGGNRGDGRNTDNEYANIEPVLIGIKANFLIGYILLNGEL